LGEDDYREFAPPKALRPWLEDGRRRERWSLDHDVRAAVEAGEAERRTLVRDARERQALQRRFADRVGAPPRLVAAASFSSRPPTTTFPNASSMNGTARP